MQPDDCIILGYVAKAHGIQGEVRAVFDVTDIHAYARKRTLWLAKGDQPLVSIGVRRFEVVSDKEAVLGFYGAGDRDAAEALRGHTIYLPKAELPPLPDGHFYFFEVIGFRVVDEAQGELGTVDRFMDGVAQDLLVMRYQDQEVLIPVTDDFVLRADKAAGIVYTRIPEGLVELYLGTADDDES
ncbi:MAG: ribosome maturation factor RimM [Bacteroidia bacterium]